MLTASGWALPRRRAEEAMSALPAPCKSSGESACCQLASLLSWLTSLSYMIWQCSRLRGITAHCSVPSSGICSISLLSLRHQEITCRLRQLLSVTIPTVQLYRSAGQLLHVSQLRFVVIFQQNAYPALYDCPSTVAGVAFHYSPIFSSVRKLTTPTPLILS